MGAAGRGRLLSGLVWQGEHPVLYRGGRGGHGHQTQSVRRGQQEGADCYQG